MIEISSSRRQRKNTITKKGRSSPLQKKAINDSDWHSRRVGFDTHALFQHKIKQINQIPNAMDEKEDISSYRSFSTTHILHIHTQTNPHINQLVKRVKRDAEKSSVQLIQIILSLGDFVVNTPPPVRHSTQQHNTSSPSNKSFG